MSVLIRRIISDKLAPLIRSSIYYELEIPPWKHSKQTQMNAANADGRLNRTPVVQWTFNSMNYDLDLLHTICQLDFDRNLIPSVKFVRAQEPGSKDFIEFSLNEDALIASTFIEGNQSIIDVNRNAMPQKALNQSPCEQNHLLFEYSSPNIAKPFHVGHLRSTIIGNVLANLHEQLGFKVTRINYLGDWGTQFGLLQLGLEMLQISDEELRSSPISTLYKAYVHANNVASTDPTVTEKARQIFRDLELSRTSEELLAKWQQYRLYTIQELESVYQRLGVAFDVYDWESQYSQRSIQHILQELEDKNLIFTETFRDESNSKAICNGDEQRKNFLGRKLFSLDGGNRLIPLTRSDGSSLYLVRDVAALLDRFNRFNFDRHFYVVENGQSDHFNACFQISSHLCQSLQDDNSNRLNHVKFGRIHGMSTRKGKAIFLSDLLDEAQYRMHLKQLQSSTTKVKVNPLSSSSDARSYQNEVADVLGVSAVIVNDLKQRRQRDYVFDWDKALQMNGDTGIKLQYTHCRLHSLIQYNAHLLEETNELKCIVPSELQEPEAQAIIYDINRFPQIIWQSAHKLEACILVNYLFSLSNATSRALKRLPIKNEPNRSKQLHRFKLFCLAKKVLGRGMEILGLKPLNAM